MGRTSWPNTGTGVGTGQTAGPTTEQSMGRTTWPTTGQTGLASEPTTERRGSGTTSFALSTAMSNSFSLPSHPPVPSVSTVREEGTTPSPCPRSGRTPATGRIPPLQFLSPNFTHSFSKIGLVPSLEFGPHDQDRYDADKPAPPNWIGYYNGTPTNMYFASPCISYISMNGQHLHHYPPLYS